MLDGHESHLSNIIALDDISNKENNLTFSLSGFAEKCR